MKKTIGYVVFLVLITAYAVVVGVLVGMLTGSGLTAFLATLVLGGGLTVAARTKEQEPMPMKKLGSAESNSSE